MNKPNYIVVHHTAVSRTKNGNQFDAVKRYHIGKGWGNIGYHWFIEPNGEIKKGREEKTDGAHCYQQGMNTKSIGVCLTGHFDEEEPTKKQIKSLHSLIADIKKQYNIIKVHGHRDFAPKTCPGKNLTDEIINNTTMEFPEWSQDSVNWCIEHKIATKFTGEPIPDYQVAVIAHNLAKKIMEWQSK